MAYNEDLDARIRRIVAQWKDTAAKKMFGGICVVFHIKLTDLF